MMKALCYGEILFDVFDEGAVIGGAPFNLCAHMARLGSDAYIVSAVGDDVNGRNAVDIARELGVGTDSIGINAFPTGFCNVKVTDGHPEYSLCEDAAFDHIRCDGIDDGFDVFCFGTLAQRNEDTRKNLYSLLDNTSFGEVFCDVNIRNGYHSEEILRRSLGYATILKFSREEFHVFGDYGLCTEKDIEKAAAEIAERFAIGCVLVTLDKDGAFAYENSEIVRSPHPASVAVSTVGAGDSFSACFLYNRMKGLSLSECLRKATLLSDYVVTQTGAVPEYPSDLLEKLI